MLAPYISYCPENTTRLAWQNFPTLHILNNPIPMPSALTQDSDCVIFEIEGSAMRWPTASLPSCLLP
jgi:hypothetical protein